MSSSVALWSQQIIDDAEATEHLKLVLSLVWVIKFVYAQHTSNALTLAQYSSSAATHALQQRLIVDIMMSCSDGYLLRPKTPQHTLKDFYVQSQRVDIANGGEQQQPPHTWPHTSVIRNEAIWFIDSLQSYYAMERDLVDAANNYKRNGYFCIVYTGLEQQQLVNVQRIFQHLLMMYVTNVNVFLAGQRVPFVYTYFPYSSRLCHRAEPQMLFSFSSISRELDAFRMPYQFFPSKVANMHGCSLHVDAIEIAPFVQVDRNVSTGAVERLHGIEGLLLTLIAERMNFSLSVLATTDRGYVHANGSATGASQRVMEGSSNMTIGIYMYDELRGMYMLPTYSHFTAQLMMGVSRGQQLTPLQRLMRPFRWRIWTIIGVILLLAAFTIVLLRLTRHAAISQRVFGRVPFTNLLNTLLGGSLYGTLPPGNYARYLLTLWLSFALVLRNAYQGELFIMLQDARALTSVRSLQEAVAHNYTFYCTFTAARILHHTVPNARVEPITATRTTASVIKRLQAGEQRLAVPLLVQTIRLVNQRTRRTSQRIDVLPEKFLTVTATFYLRRHSFLLHQFDKVLQRISSAGLVYQFESQYVDRNVDRIRVKQQPSKLSIWQLSGAFNIYLVLLALSVVVFVLEQISVHSQSLAYVLHALDF